MDGWISEKEQIVWALDFQKCPFSHQASRVRFKFMLGDAQVVYSNIAWEITSISKKDFIHLHNPLPEEAGMKTKLFGKCCCQFIKGFLPNMALFGLLMITDDKWWLMTINDDWWPFNFKQTQWLNTHTHNIWEQLICHLVSLDRAIMGNSSSGGSNPLVSDQPVWGTCNQGFQINMCFKDYRYSCLQSRTPQLFCCYESQELSFIDHNKDTVTIILSSSFLMHITAVINHQVSIPSSAWNH